MDMRASLFVLRFAAILAYCTSADMSKSSSTRGTEERLSNVKFDESMVGEQQSKFVKPVRMNFIRHNERQSQPMKLFWDMALEQDSVSVLLYHTERKQLLIVKQFRPAVFVQKVRNYPENLGKQLNEIEWDRYPVAVGETFELCAGLLDKNKSPLQTVKEEILEECGYDVNPDKIQLLKTFLTGIGISGSVQHLFYAEIDESMKTTEGGGVKAEGELIDKIIISVDDARKFVDEQKECSAPPSVLFAISWFLRTKV